METLFRSRSPGSRNHAAAGNALLVLAVIAIITGAIRYRLIDFPLERDEGGYAYMGQLILDGVPPYTQAYDYKPPGVQLVYASFIALFGGSPASIHTGLLLVSLGSMMLLYFLVRSWSDARGAAVAAFVFSILLVSPSVLGFAAHATHFVVFCTLLGCLLLERFLRHGAAWVALAAGAAFGCATLMKQAGVFFFFFALVLPFATRNDRGSSLRESLRTAGFLLGGYLIPFAGFIAWLGATGALDEFFFWTLEYPTLLAGELSATGLLPRFFRSAMPAAGNFLPAWTAAAACFAYLMTGRGGDGVRSRIALFLFCSCAAVFVGYVLRSHYFVLTLPALAAATGLAASSIASRTGSGFLRMLVSAIPCLIVTIGIVNERLYFFTADPVALSRQIYDPNQFADAEEVARFIRSGTSDTDRVAIIGSEPEILFLSRRRSATRYIFTYVFNERHSLKEQLERDMIREIDSVGPAMIVMINQPFSWGALPRRDWTILRWAGQYLERNYELAGTVSQATAGPPRFRWGEEAREDPNALTAPMIIYRKIGRIAGSATPAP